MCAPRSEGARLWFGGWGFRGTIPSFKESGMPAGVAVLIMVAAFLGPLGLLIGLLTRLAALGIAIVTLG